MINVSDFRIRFPEFAETADVRVLAAIREAEAVTHVSKDAVLHCAAHMLACMGEETGALDGGSGVVQHETIGSQNMSYRDMAGDEPREVFFSRSAYGRHVLLLENRAPAIGMGMIAV